MNVTVMGLVSGKQGMDIIEKMKRIVIYTMDLVQKFTFDNGTVNVSWDGDSH